MTGYVIRFFILYIISCDKYYQSSSQGGQTQRIGC